MAGLLIATCYKIKTKDAVLPTRRPSGSQPKPVSPHNNKLLRNSRRPWTEGGYFFCITIANNVATSVPKAIIR